MSKPNIKIGHLKITDHLVLGVSEALVKSGEQKLETCTTELMPMLSWDYIGNAFKDGDIDAAFILAPYAMELYHSEVPINLVLLGHKTGSVIIKNKKANINKLEDFKGKTILIPFHLSIHMMIMHKLLKQKGIEVGPGKDVQFEVMAPSQIPQALEWDDEGELGGFIVAEPWGAKAVKDGLGEVFALSKDVWPDHPCCVFVVKEDIIKNTPEIVQEMCNNFVSSGKLIKSDTERCSTIGAEFLDVDRDLIKTVLTDPTDRLKTSALMPEIKPFELIQQYMFKDTEALSGKVDLNKFIITDFAKNAGAV